jgi:F-type H+-transporting ATPase subunit b
VLFDWFTFAAQIVNFCILIYLLWRFLYKPINQTMDKRRKQIESNWQEAHQQREEAKAEADSYRRQRRELEEQRAEAMARAKEDAEEERKVLIRQARREVNQIEAEWRASLRRQQSDFLEQLRQQVGEQTYDLARRTLRDVVDVEIEGRAIATFLDRLRNLPQSQREGITFSLERSRSPILIRSSFELLPQQQEKLLDTLQQQFAIEKELAIVEGLEAENEESAEVPAHQLPVQFVTSARLICGISLLIAGQEIGWNFQGYLSDVEARFSRRLEAEIAKKWEPEDEKQRQMEQAKREKLQKQLVQQTYAVARRALQDLADAELEERAIAIFLKRLQALDESERQEIARALAESEKAIAVRSSFEIPQDKREQIAHQLQQKQLLDSRELKFSTSPEPICGIEMQLADRAIIWSLENYMQSLEKHLAIATDEEEE